MLQVLHWFHAEVAGGRNSWSRLTTPGTFQPLHATREPFENPEAAPELCVAPKLSPPKSTPALDMPRIEVDGGHHLPNRACGAQPSGFGALNRLQRGDIRYLEEQSRVICRTSARGLVCGNGLCKQKLGGFSAALNVGCFPQQRRFVDPRLARSPMLLRRVAATWHT